MKKRKYLIYSTELSIRIKKVISQMVRQVRIFRIIMFSYYYLVRDLKKF